MASNKCYKLAGTPVAAGSDWELCGSSNDPGHYFACCGAGHTCYTSGMCGYSFSTAGGSGWYTGACSDPSFRDSSCLTRCNNLMWSDVVWNPNTTRWNCCGNDTADQPNCQHPTNETFDAVAPSDLRAYYIAGQGPLKNSSSSTTLSSSSLHPTPPSKNSSGQSLSPGARSGIGWGVGGGALIVILLAYGMIFRRRRRRLRQGRAKKAKDIPPPFQERQLPLRPGLDAWVKPELSATERQNSSLNQSDSTPAGFIAPGESRGRGSPKRARSSRNPALVEMAAEYETPELE